MAIAEGYFKKEITACTEIDADQFAGNECHVLQPGIVQQCQRKIATLKSTVDKIGAFKVGLREIAIGEYALCILAILYGLL